MATELWRANVDLQAVLDEITMSLKDVMNLKVGQTIMLNKTPKDDIVLKCGDIPMVSGSIGRSGHHVAVQIHKTAERLKGNDHDAAGQ
ncbi:MAG: FliM/FliN family flagellar motor switch protein [Kordiimonadaceae bacterium]|nr:FliM/FliN family flagellar motor switch protein [Kordiimonadaceae bacterium]